MPNQDADRWNERYKHTKSSDLHTPRSFLIEHFSLLPAGGTALDIAMGAGKNTKVLLDKGIDVIGVDISAAAVIQAHSHFPELKAVIADLANFSMPNNYFDIILNFYYLQRDLWPDFRRVLHPGGLLIFETLTAPMLSIKPDLNPTFLLKERELADAFQDWEILVYREGWINGDRGNDKCVASMIARLPV
jgi:tellurite methyltransferase